MQRRPIALSSAGFTLIELAVVIFLIAMVMAIATPQLLPIISFSELEGQARRIANYGRSATERAMFMRERHVVRFERESGEYYLVHWIVPEDEEEAAAEAGEEEEVDHLAKLREMQQSGDLEPGELQQLLAQGGGSNPAMGRLMPDFDQEMADAQMADQFERFSRPSPRSA